MLTRALPCPTCGCESCVLFEDDFNRANTTTLPDYTEVSGNWQVTSNRLATPATGILKVNLATPAAPDGILATVTGNFGSGTGEMLLLVDYVNSSTFQLAKIVWDGVNATLELVRFDSGADTALTVPAEITSFSASADFTLTVCWNDYRIAATYLAGAVEVFCAASSASLGGDYTGLATVGLTGPARFDDLSVWSLLSDSAPCPPCPNCDLMTDDCECAETPECVCNYACEGAGALSYCDIQVELSGIGDGTCAASCSAANGTFLLTGGGCSWGYTLPSPINCGAKTFDRIECVFGKQGGGSPNISLRVRLVSTDWPIWPGSKAIGWYTIADPALFDCQNFSDYSIALSFNPGAGMCVSDGTPALVTSVPP